MTKQLTNFDMHADHRYWENQLTLWEFDLEEWQSEHKEALANLQKIVEMIRQHEEVTANHGQHITALRGEINNREHELAKQSESNPSGDASLLAGGHEERTQSVEALRLVHERVKKHHHIAIAKVFALKASLEAAM